MLQITNNLPTFFENSIEELNHKLEIQKANQSRFTQLYNSVNFSKIETMLSKLGLTSLSLTTQFHNDSDSLELIKSKPLYLDICVQIEEQSKIRPVRFQGYTKSGAGKNHDQLLKKAESISEKVTKLCGYECSINQYGLELDRRNPEKPHRFSIFLKVF